MGKNKTGVKDEVAETIRIYLVHKLRFWPLIYLVAAIIIVLASEDQNMKTLSIYSGAAISISFILFCLLGHRIISKKFQIKKYLISLDNTIRFWEERTAFYEDKKGTILNTDSLLIEPWPIISRNMEKILSEAIKIKQSINDQNEGYKESLHLAISLYNYLCSRFHQVGLEAKLYEPLKIIQNNLKNSEERTLAAISFFESCKTEHERLPELANGYKKNLVNLADYEIARCNEEIGHIKNKKNQAVLMLENL